jgi:hypothetical protein
MPATQPPLAGLVFVPDLQPDQLVVDPLVIDKQPYRNRSEDDEHNNVPWET